MITDRVRLKCPACVPEQVDEFVGTLARRSGLDRGRSYWLRLAADEITTNIGQHGYRGRGGMLDLSGAVEPDRIWVCIEDAAPRFDPRSHDPTQLLATDLAERRPGGYGLLLALTNVDDFDYEYRDGRNRNTLIMYLPGPATSRAGGRKASDGRDTRDGGS